MPHLQFEINRILDNDAKISFAEKVRQLFSRVMDTGTDHISISIREFGVHNLSIGRAKEPEKGIALVNADIREGRTLEQRRKLTLGFMDLLHATWGIPKEQMYVTLTEHRGEDFHLLERYLAGWEEGEDPLAG
ncbi:tautomerase [Geothermobacter hydrogeniphilus]|uniref:Tautomerase n=1 Tax=Geothermobacter hydrogeniphilus TaxID=1969733 RepID=A0A2K2HAE1_9BACT|nr:tautomerase [Geothermobacter hydrogeniphilus]PNU20193.1 tautomerase [Geothermobacter hydrogeniphilus]